MREALLMSFLSIVPSSLGHCCHILIGAVAVVISMGDDYGRLAY
jgi:hypothetical protein